MIIVFLRCSSCKIPDGNIFAKQRVKVVLNLFGITFKQTFYQFTGTGFHDGIGLKVIQNFISETVSYFFIRNVQPVFIIFRIIG